MSLEENICFQKLAAENQRKNELKNKCNYKIKRIKSIHFLKIPIGCIEYFNKGCYSCSGIDKKDECKCYTLLQ